MTKEKKLMSETHSGRSVYRPHKYSTTSSDEDVHKKKVSSEKDTMMRTLHQLRKMVEDQDKGETAMPLKSLQIDTSASPAASVAASTSSATSVASGNGQIAFTHHKDYESSSEGSSCPSTTEPPCNLFF